MHSLSIILSLLVFRDYKEIRLGMIISGVIFIVIGVLFIVCLFNNLKTEELLLFILFLIDFLLETIYLPKIWKSRRIWKK